MSSSHHILSNIRQVGLQFDGPPDEPAPEQDDIALIIAEKAQMEAEGLDAIENGSTRFAKNSGTGINFEKEIKNKKPVTKVGKVKRITTD